MNMLSLDGSKWKKLVVILFIVHGLFGFMCFICEEAMQTAMFGAFAYNSAKDYDGLQRHIQEVMIPTHKVSSALIKGFGWLAPITFPAYLMYLRTNKGYIKAAQSLAREG